MKLKRSSCDRCSYHILIFIISHLWSGIDSESIPGYSINVSHYVTVQRGLCVHIPCRFTVPETKTLTRRAVGIWIKINGVIVANNSKRNNQFLSNGRFFLDGDVRSGDCSLYIEDPLHEDQGFYSFRVEDKIKFSYQDITPYVQVTDLKDKPEISPIKSWIHGEEATLTCKSPGRCKNKRIKPQITWEGNIQSTKLVNQVTDHKNGTKTHFSTTTFTAWKEQNNSTLSCIVELKEGLTTAQHITMKVECIDSRFHPGYCIKAPHRVTVQRGLCVYIPCQFTVPESETLTTDAVGIWYNTSGHIVASNSEWNNQFLSNGRFSLDGDVWRGDCSLYIEDPLHEDEGHYRFRVEDNILFSYLDIQPYVEVTDLIDKPEISPINSWVDGEEVILTCTFSVICKTINPLISWEGNIQNTNVVNRVTNHENGTKTYLSTITFTARKEQNNSTLSCIVQLREGVTTVQQMTIQVEYPPRAPEIQCSIISKEPSNCTIDGDNTIYILEGSQLSLTCSADSVPESSLEWKSSNQTHNSSSIDKLTFTNMSLTNEGLYTCQATNAHGTKETSVTIRVTFHLTSKPFPAAAIFGGCFAAVLIATGIFLIMFYKKRKMMQKKENSRQNHVSVADPIYGNAEMFPNGPHEVGTIPQKDDQSPPETETVHLNCQDVQYMSVNFSNLKPQAAGETEEIEYAVVKHKN